MVALVACGDSGGPVASETPGSAIEDATGGGEDSSDAADGPDVVAPPGLEVSEADGVTAVDNGLLSLACDESDGTCELALASGDVVARRAWSEVLYRVGAAKEELAFGSLDASTIDVSSAQGQSLLGPYVALTLVAAAPDAPTLTTELRVYEGQPFVTVDLTVANPASSAITVTVLRPWAVSVSTGGGLFVGAVADDHVVLDNGQLKYLDFAASLHGGDENTVSNWNAAIVDPQTGRGLVAGWLSTRKVAPTVVVWNGWEDGLDDPATGRQAFAEFSFEATYEPPTVLGPGGSLASERAYLDPATGDPHAALEDYADRIRVDLGYALWDGPSPNGWNSWSSSGSTGGYGTSIDEALMLDNLDFMVEHLRDFGVHWFQIDDGWQDYTGDWNAHAERFPHGMKWFAEQVEAQGLLPGIWVQPMAVSTGSALYLEHPEWLVDGPDGPLLDPTQPAVRAHLTALFSKITKEWGFRWVKVDFAYQLLLASGYANPNLTAEEVYRTGMLAIRQGLDADVFLLSVAAPGLNYDISHANRITLDVMPRWGQGVSATGQGFTHIARTIARRWYLHGRAQITHPDLVVFRDEGTGGTAPDAPNAMRPLHEAICFASLVALTGGIVKVGDRMAIDLGPEHIDVLRRLLPSYDRPGRPVDVFERTTPEVWSLPISTPWESWNVTGLIHWGLNGPGLTITDTEETTRHFSVPLERLELDPGADHLGFEYWSETYLGVVQGALELDVEPRHAAMVSLRVRRAGEVQLLASNRHVTMGATDIESVGWDADAGTLHGTQPVAPGWPYLLWFHVPEGRAVTGVLVDGEPGTWEHPEVDQPSLVRLSFQRAEAGSVTWQVETAPAP